MLACRRQLYRSSLQQSVACAAFEGVVREIFSHHQSFEADRSVLGSGRQEVVLKAVLDQAWTGIKDYSEDFYKVILVAETETQSKAPFRF